MVSVRRTPGTRGWPGKWPSKTGLSIGTVERASIRFASRSRRDDPVDHFEIFEAHAAGPCRVANDAGGQGRTPPALEGLSADPPFALP